MRLALLSRVDYGVDEVQASRTCERFLVAAVLERAIRDLDKNAVPFIKNKAINWFRYKRKGGRDVRFTFLQVKEILDLTPAQLEIIDTKVYLASKHLKETS